MTKDERFALVMEKLKAAPPVDFHIDAIGTFCMVAGMRLALRHPGFSGPLKSIVRAISDNLTAALIKGEPDLEEFMDDLANESPPPDPESQQAIIE